MRAVPEDLEVVPVDDPVMGGYEGSCTYRGGVITTWVPGTAGDCLDDLLAIMDAVDAGLLPGFDVRYKYESTCGCG